MGGFVGSYPAGTPSRLRRRVRRAKRRYRDSRAPAVDSGRAVVPSGGGGGTLLLMLLGGIPAGIYLADVRPAVSRYSRGSGPNRRRW